MSLPRPDVGGVALAARLAVRAQREHVDLAADAGVEVLVVVAPGILRELLQVAAGLPVARYVAAIGLLDERLQPLLVARVDAAVELVELQGAHDRIDVGARGGRPRLVGPVHDARHDQRRHDGENGDDDEDFDQREAARAAEGWRRLSHGGSGVSRSPYCGRFRRHQRTSVFMSKIGRRMATTTNSTTNPMATISSGSSSAVSPRTQLSTSRDCASAARASMVSRRPVASPLAIKWM